MEETKNEDYEERAAIREFDGGQSKDKAEFYARLEIDVRNAQRNIQTRREKYKQKLQQNYNQQGQQQQPIPQEKRSKIDALREKLEQTGNKMRAVTDSARKDELFGKWMEILNQILELRKAK